MSEQLVEVKDLKVTYYQNGVETPVVYHHRRDP